MHGSKKLFHVARLVVICLFVLIVAGGSYSNTSAASIAVSRPHVASSAKQAGFISHQIKIKPVVKNLGNVQSVGLKAAQVNSTNKVLFPCQSNVTNYLCYGPSQIQHAYAVQKLLQRGITGKGSTIIIIDAFGSPTIQADLQAFDAAWGLPNPAFTVVAPYGVSGTDPSWAGETTLDVEWAHVMAPGAAITLVEASTNTDVDLYNAIKYAVDNNLGDVISQSFGENESCVDPNLLVAEHQVFQNAADKGITVLASAGDSGSAQGACVGFAFTKAVSYPANDPLVTSLGGTALTADAVTGNYLGETAWNEFLFGTGGGYSVVYPRPNYQSDSTGNIPGRGVPDLALNASLNGGVTVLQTDPVTGLETLQIAGGTSVSSPEFAGLVADGVQLAHHRLGFLNRGIYTLGKSSQHGSAFNDIISGNNILILFGVDGYTVSRGWDPVTGWGTPNAEDFLPLLISRLHSHDASSL